MFKEVFILLLLAHVLGDFYAQTDSMAKRKDQSLRWVLIHCLFYLLVTVAVLFLFMSWNALIFGAMIVLAHAAIDLIKYCFVIKPANKMEMTPERERNIFFYDQLINIGCIAMIAYIAVSRNAGLNAIESISRVFEITGISQKALISWVTAILVIYKPVRIAISKMLMPYKQENKDDDKDKDKNAGRFIGTLERIIILIFISLGQYAAIGLVLTAKSIARYDKIARERSFAEYYLLGTLLSAAAAIVVSFMI